MHFVLHSSVILKRLFECPASFWLQNTLLEVKEIITLLKLRGMFVPWTVIFSGSLDAESFYSHGQALFHNTVKTEMYHLYHYRVSIPTAV